MLFHLLQKEEQGKTTRSFCPRNWPLKKRGGWQQCLCPPQPLSFLMELSEKKLRGWQEIEEAEEEEERSRRLQSLFEIHRDKLAGRQIAEHDWEGMAREWRMTTEEVPLLLHQFVLEGVGTWTPAIQRTARGRYCARCGEKALIAWPSVYGESWTCPSCRRLGALTSLQALFRGEEGQKEKRGAFVSPKAGDEETAADFSYAGLQLSEAQRRSAEILLAWSREKKREKLLLWAACGAGKTEVCFPLIQEALEKGERVLFAAPRQDVIHDVLPRLERSFPETEVLGLTGQLPAAFTPASLIAATTHQVLRFYKAFDLIFFDEMDAYPYGENTILRWGLEKAGRESCARVFLTATPSPEILAEAKKGRCRLVRLPARFHRKPLPDPQWRSSREWEKVLQELFSQGPVLIFVPLIRMVEEWVDMLRKKYPSLSVEGSWSADPRRREKVEQLKAGVFDFFVSTLILERGVTVKNIQVLVWDAQHKVFDVRSLVQMAGRAGRAADYPQGIVVFLAPRKTKKIQQAQQWILQQNNWAKKAGLLDA